MAKLGLQKSCKFPTFGSTRGHQKPENVVPGMWYTFWGLILAKMGHIVKIATFGDISETSEKWSKMAISWFWQKHHVPQKRTLNAHMVKNAQENELPRVCKKTRFGSHICHFLGYTSCVHTFCVLCTIGDLVFFGISHMCAKGRHLCDTRFWPKCQFYDFSKVTKRVKKRRLNAQHTFFAETGRIRKKSHSQKEGAHNFDPKFAKVSKNVSFCVPLFVFFVHFLQGPFFGKSPPCGN